MATAYIIGEKQDLEHLKFLPEMSKDANKILQSRGNTNKDTEDATLNPQRQKRQSRARSDGRRQKAVHTHEGSPPDIRIHNRNQQR